MFTSSKNCQEQIFSDKHNNGDRNGSFEAIKEAAEYIRSKTKLCPQIGIICGSGLGSLTDQVEEKEEFMYESIPHFPLSTVKGHVGKLVLGKLSGKTVLCMQGRFHIYEGYTLEKVTIPVRLMKLLGIKTLIVTNAAGGVNEQFNIGDLMIIKDHIYLQGFAGESPLKGQNDERFGPRFPAMNDCYSPRLRQLAKKTLEQNGLGSIAREGVYIMVGGPSYETPAEIKFLRNLGVDAVGMSTVPEVVVARHCDMEVFAFSLITNICVAEYESTAKANHAEVLSTADQRKKDLQLFIGQFIRDM